MKEWLARVNWSIVGWLALGVAFGILEHLGLKSSTDRKFTASHLLSTMIDNHLWFRALAYAGWAWLGYHLFILGRHHIFA